MVDDEVEGMVLEVLGLLDVSAGFSSEVRDEEGDGVGSLTKPYCGEISSTRVVCSSLDITDGCKVDRESDVCVEVDPYIDEVRCPSPEAWRGSSQNLLEAEGILSEASASMEMIDRRERLSQLVVA